MKVQKKDNRIEEFDIIKLINVLDKANNNLSKVKQLNSEDIRNLAKKIVEQIINQGNKVTSSTIEKTVEIVLIENN